MMPLRRHLLAACALDGCLVLRDRPSDICRAPPSGVPNPSNMGRTSESSLQIQLDLTSWDNTVRLDRIQAKNDRIFPNFFCVRVLRRRRLIPGVNGRILRRYRRIAQMTFVCCLLAVALE